MKVRCDIQGLDCPHCALNLEKKLSKLDGVISASINFPLGSLVFDVNDDMDEDGLVEAAQKEADDFEDGISISLRD